MRYRHLILDRDGVLNFEAPPPGFVVRPEDFRWLPGALEALALLHRAGIRLSVATNQSGVGRGLMTLDELQAVHARMRAEAELAGGALDAVLCCPHAPDAGCPCRKPEPGLIREAIALSSISAEESLVIGDDDRDLQAAQHAGVLAALVRTGKGRATEAQLTDRSAVAVYDDLRALARAIAENT
ncbi:MAG TPA: HAD-IIIA family hydrolase [Steroidobacteraceae bacterium]|nr:HAD-IIIA family hydrolase [Steroidobacteraceae bacterium]